MDYPTTAAEWWELLNKNLEDVRMLVHNYHPAMHAHRKPMKITAPNAEEACEKIRKQLAKRGSSPVDDFNMALEAKDGPAMVSLLNGAWFGMPEAFEVRSEPGFHVLCDLCSEGCVLHEGDYDGDE